ncbi:hypothetical protein KV679_01725 [Bacillus sp. JRC01]|nr:hypothetical protein [Bacillus sp. JRC01]
MRPWGLHEEASKYHEYSFGERVKPTLSLSYNDSDYRFSFGVPLSWLNRYLVQTKDTSEIFEPYQPSKVIQLSMVEDGKFVGRLVTIGVLEDVTEKEVADHYEGSLGTEAFLAAGDDIVLVYSIPYEPPGQTYEGEYLELGEQYLQMVQEDMEEVFKR